MQDYVVNDFSGGYMTNAAYHPGRQKSGQHVLDCRSQDQGWLIPRKGYVGVSSESGFTEVFVHQQFLLAVLDGILKWARVPDDPTAQLTFHDFVSGGSRIKNGDTERVVFHSQDDFVYISIGTASFVVEIPELAINLPQVYPFYLSKVPSIGFEYVSEGGKPTDGEFDVYELVFQAVWIRDDQPELPTQQGGGLLLSALNLANRVSVAPITGPLLANVREATVTEGGIASLLSNWIAFPNPFVSQITIQFDIVVPSPLKITVHQTLSPTLERVKTLHDSLDGTDAEFGVGRKNVSWDGTDSDGNQVPNGPYTVQILTKNDISSTLTIAKANQAGTVATPEPERTQTVIEIRVSEKVSASPENYIDIYARQDIDADYTFIARMPYDATRPLRYVFPLEKIQEGEPLVDAGEQVNFQYVATNEFRTYVADAESNKVYKSYYNPANNEALRQNFVDITPLELEGGAITGLHFLRDTFLYVYTTNQLQVIATDPIAELHRVVDYIKPRSDKGEIIGCAAPDTIVNIVGRHYFLATNQRVYRFDGQRLYDVSDRVHAAFQKVLTPTAEGQLQLQEAIAYAVDENYVISVNMAIPGEEAPSATQNRLLVYDVTHGVWWQDAYGIDAVSKGIYDTVYGVIGGYLYRLHSGDTDDGKPIRRIWRGHPYQTTTQKTWESVHVHPLQPCRIDITARTEQDAFTGYVDIENIASFDEKRMGCDLRGAVQTVEIQTDSDATIHRIAVNERVRNR